MSNEYNVNLLIKQTKLIAKDINKHNKKYSGFKDLLKDNIPESLVDYNGNAYDISSVFHDTNWSDNTKTPSINSSQSNQKFSQIETNANLELYKNAKLVPHEDASGTTHKLWTVYDDASNNLLEHIVDFSFDISGSYLPILTYYNGSAYVESTMFSDPLWWLIDYENHAISFFNTDSVLNGGTVNISASSATPPKLTFYRYIGKTKVNNKLSVEGDISCNEVIVSGTTLTSKLGVIDLSYSDLSGVVTTNIGNISSNTNNKAPKASPTFTGNVTCNSGLNVSQGSSSDSPIVFDNNFPKPAINKQTSGLNFFHYLDGSPTRNYDLFIKSDTGNVGIGTSSPGAKLDVANTEPKIYLTNNKNGSSFSNNEILGTIALYSKDQNSSSDLGETASINFVSTYGGVAPYPGISFNVNRNISSNNQSVIEAMRIDHNGNVGIGTTSPGAKLEVEGNLLNNACINIKSQTSTNQIYELKIRDDTTNYPLHIGPGTAFDGINISNNGNVGIGTTTAMDNKLEIKGNVRIRKGNNDGNPTITFSEEHTSGSPNNDWQIKYFATDNSLRIGSINNTIASGNENVLVFDDNGNIGIGTTSPSNLLSINKPFTGITDTTQENGISFYTNIYSHAPASDSNTYPVTPHKGATIFISPIRYDAASSTHATTHCRLNFATGSGSGLSTSTVRMVIESGSGAVGIGRTGPSSAFKLDVGGSIRVSSTTYSSDKRIKENIRDVSDSDALQKVRDISCCYYEYIDKENRGDKTVIGFIAQNVYKHYPQSVTICKTIIPNEMRLITDYSWEQLPDASGNYDSSNNEYKLTINDLSDNSGNTLYRFYVYEDVSKNKQELELYSLPEDPKSFVFDQSWNNVYLYGKQVDDFHTVDKQKLFALNFSATQEIDRIQQSEQVKLAAAEAKITTLETENESLKTEVASLKSTLDSVLTRLSALESSN